jgi:hypothetical protein
MAEYLLANDPENFKKNGPNRKVSELPNLRTLTPIIRDFKELKKSVRSQSGEIEALQVVGV